MAQILVIDDDRQCVELLMLAFGQDGHTVSSAADGKNGLKLAREEKFDLIITDVLMPEKDGLEFIKEIRREKPDVAIIAISGGGLMYAEDCLTMAKLLGAKQVLKKPLNIGQLLQIANELEHFSK